MNQTKSELELSVHRETLSEDNLQSGKRLKFAIGCIYRKLNAIRFKSSPINLIGSKSSQSSPKSIKSTNSHK